MSVVADRFGSVLRNICLAGLALAPDFATASGPVTAQLYVKLENGGWKQARLENPAVVMPAFINVTNGSTSMGMVTIIGDRTFTPTVVIFSRGGTFENRVTDPNVQVVLTPNNSGGMTIFLTGKPSASRGASRT